MNRTEATRLLVKAQDAQLAFWDALSELQDALDVEVESTRDLSNEDLDSLREYDSPGRERPEFAPGWCVDCGERCVADGSLAVVCPRCDAKE